MVGLCIAESNKPLMQLLFITKKTRKQNFLLNFGLSLVEALVRTLDFLHLHGSVSWKQFK